MLTAEIVIELNKLVTMFISYNASPEVLNFSYQQIFDKIRCIWLKRAYKNFWKTSFCFMCTSLDDFSNKVVLNFMFAWCEPLRKDRNGSNADYSNLLQTKHSLTYQRFLAHHVQLWELQKYLCRHIFVQDTINDRWHRRKKEIEKNQDPVVSHWCAWKPTEELVPEQEVHIGLESQRWHDKMLPVDKGFKSQEENRQIFSTVLCGKIITNAVEFMPILHFKIIFD